MPQKSSATDERRRRRRSPSKEAVSDNARKRLRPPGNDEPRRKKHGLADRDKNISKKPSSNEERRRQRRHHSPSKEPASDNARKRLRPAENNESGKTKTRDVHSATAPPKKEDRQQSRQKTSPSSASATSKPKSTTLNAVVDGANAVAPDGSDNFTNAGFGGPSPPRPSPNISGNSGFANQGFSSTTRPHSRGPNRDGRRSTNLQGSSSSVSASNKPRILPPNVPPSLSVSANNRQQNGRYQPPTKPNTFNIIVNELSEVSIKREEHPLKGFGRMASRPYRAQPFVARRGQGVGGGTFVGATNQQQRGMGQRDGMMNPSAARYRWSTTTEQYKSGSFSNASATFGQQQQLNNNANSDRFRNRAGDKRNGNDAVGPQVLPVAAPGKAVQSSVVVVGGVSASTVTGGDGADGLQQNPLAVPRGRNYFLHDPRADDSTTVTAAPQYQRDSRTARIHQLYDPRVDRGKVGGVSDGRRSGRPPMGDNRSRGRFDQSSQHTTHSGSATTGRTTVTSSSTTAESAKVPPPPLGWRNSQFGDGTGGGVDNEHHHHVSQASHYSRRASSGTFGGRGGMSDASLGGRPPPYRRSKADEDFVWSHDKFFEEEQAETKLELVDEVNVNATAVVVAADATDSSKYEDPWTGQSLASPMFSTGGGDAVISENNGHRKLIDALSGIKKAVDNEAAPAAAAPEAAFDEDAEELLYD